MTDVTFLTPSEAIIGAVNLATFGDLVAARGLPALEVRYPTITILQPWQLPPSTPGRRANWAIGALEACSIVGQASVPEWITDRVRAFEDFVEDGAMWGAYGPRIAGQLGLAVKVLARDRDSRQAVVTIFDGHRDLARETKDTPCTIAIQFMIRGGALEARTVMRSNDAWLGFTYDVVQFIALQGAVAQALRVPMGPYIHQPGSLHLYASDAEKAKTIAHGYRAEVAKPYEPLFHATTLDEISQWARRAAGGRAPYAVTPFEKWIREQVG